MDNSLTTTLQSRAAFLRSLGLSTAALTAFYFSACSKRATTLTPDPTDGTDSPAVYTGNTDWSTGKVDFAIDLTVPDNAKLKTVGQFVSAGLIVVANTNGGQYVALRSVCTHASGSLWYRISQNDFRCLDHGGLFKTDGSVKMQPPQQPVQTYAVSLMANGTVLHITG